jgi:hypothetical protein
VRHSVSKRAKLDGSAGQEEITSTRAAAAVSSLSVRWISQSDQLSSQEASHSVGLTAIKEAILTVRKSAGASMQINMQIHFSTPSHSPSHTSRCTHDADLHARREGTGKQFWNLSGDRENVQ